MAWRYWLFPAALLACLGAVAPAAAADDLLDLQQKAVKAAVAQVAPSVVQIETFGGSEVMTTGPGGKSMMRKGAGPTTGLIVGVDGYIISSAFNFANKPGTIDVHIPGKGKLAAKIVATDQTRMLTLLKVDATELPVPTAAPKKEFQIGQWAVALGRTFTQPDDKQMTGSPSMSIGIISAVNRIWGRAIQTDAKVSPANYGGPLIDISGRVEGILVPASPRQDDQTAGIEWYDSGIGFAIPLEDVNAVLPRLKLGKDLRRGLLGVNLAGGDMYTGRPTVASVAPESAAEKSDIRIGDVITAVDDHEVGSLAQLQHQIGDKYEGDVVTVSVERGGKAIKVANVTLAGTLTAYPQAFLGVLPVRDDPELGEEIRYVYPDSPAAKAGLKAGDRLMKFQFTGMPQPQPFSGRDELSAALTRVPPGTGVTFEVVRKEGGKTENVVVKLGAMTDAIPDKLPELSTLKKALEPRKVAGGKPPPKPARDDKKPETGTLKRTNASRGHEYWVYVPEKYDPNISYGLVLWLHPVGKGKKDDIEQMIANWEFTCDDNHLIFVAPKGEGENGWLASESDVLQQIVRDVMSQYTVDQHRVVAHGMGVGGQMAFYLGFGVRDMFRGVATTGATAAQVKDNVANQPVSFFVVVGDKDPLLKEVQDTKEKLLAKKFPVAYRERADKGSEYLNRDLREELVRWIDSLDRQ